MAIKKKLTKKQQHIKNIAQTLLKQKKQLLFTTGFFQEQKEKKNVSKTKNKTNKTTKANIAIRKRKVSRAKLSND